VSVYASGVVGCPGSCLVGGTSAVVVVAVAVVAGMDAYAAGYCWWRSSSLLWPWVSNFVVCVVVVVVVGGPEDRFGADGTAS